MAHLSSHERVKKIPTDVLSDPDATINAIVSALQKSVFFLTHESVDAGTYTNLCTLLIDVVIPRLVRHHPHRRQDYISHVHDIFLNGIPSIAFTQLCTTLTTSSSTSSSILIVDTIALVLLHFVSDSRGGVHRLSRVLSNPHHTSSHVINHLIHLPSNISNVLLSQQQSYSTDQFAQIIEEKVYFKTLSNAIYQQSLTSDVQRDQLLAQLISRLVVIKHAHTFISALLSHDDGDSTRILTLLQKAPPSSIHALVRAILNTPSSSCHSERLIVTVLSHLLNSNQSAKNAILYDIPLRHPLFKNVRQATKRIAQSLRYVKDKSVVNKALIATVEMWSNEEFTLGADVMLQRQVTRLLLYYLRLSSLYWKKYPSRNKTNNSNDHDTENVNVTMTIVEGLHLRLQESDLRIRRHAMVVGEAASRHARDKELLTFERSELLGATSEQNRVFGDESVDDGGDSDFSEIARNVSIHDEDSSDGDKDESVKDSFFDIPSEETDDLQEKNKPETGLKSSSPLTQANGTPKRKRAKKTKKDTVVYTWPDHAKGVWQQQDEDDDSPEEYESSSDEGERSAFEQQGTVLREKLPAPMSVGRVLELLREMNSSDGGAITVQAHEALATLNLLTTRAQQSKHAVGNEALHAAASSISFELCRFDVERYPDEEINALREARSDALVAIIRLDVVTCGIELVRSFICSATSDISTRLNTLSALAQAVRVHYVASHSSISERPEFLDGLTKVFSALLEGMCDGAGGAEFIQPDERDCRLWAQTLIVLGAFSDNAGKTVHGKWMRKQLMEVIINRVALINGEPTVRRAIALVLAAVIDAMDDSEISQLFIEPDGIVLLQHHATDTDVPDRCVRWLQNASENDADVGARRFARVAIQKWAERIDSIQK